MIFIQLPSFLASISAQHMGDPNDNETLSSSTAIGKIYPVSLTVLRFAVIAFRPDIDFFSELSIES